VPHLSADAGREGITPSRPRRDDPDKALTDCDHGDSGTLEDHSIRHHHAGHDLRVLHVCDRAELDVPGSGLIEAVDAETGEHLEADLDEIRDAWRAAVADHLERLRHSIFACPAGYRLLFTDEEPASVLRDLT
jgi:hypothetical protein